MANPNPVVVGEAQQLVSRVIQISHAAAREVAPRGAHVGVENGIAAKDIIYGNLCQPSPQIPILSW